MKSGYEKKKKNTKQYKIEHWNKPGAELANKDHPKKKQKENDYWEEKGRVHPFLLTPLPVLARIFQTQPKM